MQLTLEARVSEVGGQGHLPSPTGSQDRPIEHRGVGDFENHGRPAGYLRGAVYGRLGAVGQVRFDPVAINNVARLVEIWQRRS
jgi:hypothetical protein